MARNYGKFDAKAYWATKPLCLICKNHKVKNGTVCYQCKNVMEQKISSTKNIEPINTEPQESAVIKEEQKVSQIKFD